VPSRLLGFVAQGKKLSIVKLNASTLAPVSKALPTGSADVSYVARSPGRGTRVAFAAGASSLRFLDRTHMRWDGRVAFPGRPATALWNYANKLVTLTETAQIVVVDPTKRRLRAQRSVGGTLAAFTVAGDRIVAVVAPLDGIGPAKLAVIDDAGRARVTLLPQIRAGSETLENGSVFRYEWPALAVDPRCPRRPSSTTFQRRKISSTADSRPSRSSCERQSVSAREGRRSSPPFASSSSSRADFSSQMTRRRRES
jgi:hypothetical protein